MFVVGGVLGSYGTYLPNGLDGNLSVRIQVQGSPAYTVIAFSYLLVLVYSLTLAPIAWVYAAEVWSLETRATGMALASVANWYVQTPIYRSLPFLLTLQGFSTSPLDSSFRPASKTSPGSSSSSSASSVLAPPSRLFSLIPRQLARRSRRLN